jgi:hypothetical protein
MIVKTISFKQEVIGLHSDIVFVTTAQEIQKIVSRSSDQSTGKRRVGSQNGRLVYREMVVKTLMSISKL